MVLKLIVSHSLFLLLLEHIVPLPSKMELQLVFWNICIHFLVCWVIHKSVKSLILNFVTEFRNSACLVTIELFLTGEIFCRAAEKTFCSSPFLKPNVSAQMLFFFICQIVELLLHISCLASLSVHLTQKMLEDAGAVHG